MQAKSPARSLVSEVCNLLVRSVNNPFAQALSLLRRSDLTSHIYVPGANGVSVGGLASNNYLLSDGSTGYSTVDSVVGLMLDGMGSLGSERVTNGSFATNDFTGWTVGAGTWSAATGVAICTAGTNSTISQNILTIGTTYQITFDVVSLTGTFFMYAGAAIAATITSTGTKTVYLKCAGDTVLYAQFSSTSTGSIDNISVKEFTGIHATQSTTANKPLVRRGAYNLPTYSSDLTNAAWAVNGTATKSGNQLTLTASSSSFLYRATTVATATNATYTMAALLSTSSGTMDVRLSRTDGTTWATASVSPTITLTTTPTLCVLTYVAVGAAASDFIIGGEIKTPFNPSAGTVIVGACGIFPGTWTAAQILAEGGIPTTTTTAASNPNAGKYWLSFDGSNDSLLVGNIGFTNACTIIVAGRVNSLGTYVLFDEDFDGVRVYLEIGGDIVFTKPGSAALATSASGLIVAGVPFVITARLSGGVAVIRLNGVQVVTAASAAVFAAVAGARIGSNFAGTAYNVNGALGELIALPQGLTDAECLVAERYVASLFPAGPVF